MQKFVYEKKTKKNCVGTLDNCMHEMASIGNAGKCERFVSVLRDYVLFLIKFMGVIKYGSNKT